MNQMILWFGIDQSKKRQRLVIHEQLAIEAMMSDRPVYWKWQTLLSYTQVLWKRDD